MPFIKVSFYDDEHKEKLKSTPKYEVIKQLVEKGFKCSDVDLWTYSLFTEQKPFPGFRNFQELQLLLPRRWAIIEDYFYLGESFESPLRAKIPGAKSQKLTEELGVGAALALVSHIHGLTQADWDIIDVSQNKDLDFSIDLSKQRIIDSLIKPINQPSADNNEGKKINKIDSDLKVASDGERFIEVEAKGCYVEIDIKEKISQNKAKIEKKKKSQREEQNNRNVLYGVITSYSANTNVIAHSRILDPPAVYNPEINPRKIRLLSRLNFYLDQLNLFSRANYLIALANRIRDINVLDNYEYLSTQSLLNRNGEKFNIPSSYNISRTIVNLNEGTGVGEVFPISSSQYFFFGFDILIIEKLIDQNFSEILDYRCSLPSSIYIEVAAKLKISDLRLYRISYEESESNRAGNRVVMLLSGTLYINSAGIILGMLS